MRAGSCGFTCAWIIFAAVKMKRLEAYWLAVAASVLAAIITPGNIIGLAIGVWALAVLSSRDVRAAFSRGGRRNGGSANPRSPLAAR